MSSGGTEEASGTALSGAGSGAGNGTSSGGHPDTAATVLTSDAAGTPIPPGTADIPLPPLAGIKEEPSHATSAGAELLRASRESLGPEPTAALLGTPFAQQEALGVSAPALSPAAGSGQQGTSIASTASVMLPTGPAAGVSKAGAAPEEGNAGSTAECMDGRSGGRVGRISSSGGVPQAGGQRAGRPLSRTRLQPATTTTSSAAPQPSNTVPAPLSGSPVHPDAAALMSDGIQLLPASSSMRRSALLSSSPIQGGRSIMKQATFSPPRPTPQQVCGGRTSRCVVPPATVPLCFNASGNLQRDVAA
jgi:hypothetical protein